MGAKNILKLLLKLSISGLALYFVFKHIDTSATFQLIGSAHPGYLLLALLSLFLSQVVSSFRLHDFFKAIELNLSQIFNFKLYLAGMFYNLFLPGGFGGDGYKVYILRKKFGKKISLLVQAAILDRVSGLVAIVAILVAFFPLLEAGSSKKMIALIGLPFLYLIFLFLIKRLFPVFLKVLRKTNFQSLCIQGLQLLCAVFILVSIGTEDGLLNYLFLFLLSSIASAIPVTIGGVGSREIVFLFGADYLTTIVASSIALSLLFFILTALIALGGLYFSVNDNYINSIE